MYYRLPGRGASSIVRQALSWIRQAASEDGRIQADAVRMKKILGTSREILCGRQSNRRKRGTNSERAISI
jgi:hypothetical protein